MVNNFFKKFDITISAYLLQIFLSLMAIIVLLAVIFNTPKNGNDLYKSWICTL